MPAVTGTMEDLQLANAFGTNNHPQVRFIPWSVDGGNSRIGVQGSFLFAPRVIVVIPDELTLEFTVSLAATYGIEGIDGYLVETQWVSDDPDVPPTGWARVDGILRVPPEGGRVGDLIDLNNSPLGVLVQLAPPPAGYKGWYLNAPGPGEPVGDPDNPASSGTGILEMVS